MKKILACILTLFFCVGPIRAKENEVIQPTGARVFIREHPQTGKPFVSIRSDGNAADLFRGFVKREVRPDYKMLDAKIKSGEVPYDGPVSDKKKVYIFAATMMTLGVAGGIVTAAMPAGAAAAGASGGTGLLGTEAVTIVAATAGTVAVKSHIAPGEENYIHDANTIAAAGIPKNLSLRDVLDEIDAEGKSFPL